MRRALLALGALVLLATAWLVLALRDRPDLAAYERLQLTPSTREAAGVRVTFAGVSTVLVDDGETAILTDGFFTRPSLARTAFGRIAPDDDAIDRGLARLGVESLAAVVVVHSHHDHAMDAPVVAARTGALLVGSESTANVARGLGFPEGDLRIMPDGGTLRAGAFTIRLIVSRHFPHGMAMGAIDEPLVPPARASAYLEGGSYSVLLEHPAGALLIQGSAGWVDGALADRRADVVLLGIGALGSSDDAYRAGYWDAVVEAVQPRLVVPIHWDDFTESGSRPLVPMPGLLDDVEASMRFLIDRTDEPGAPRLAMLPPWRPVVLLPMPPGG